MGGGNCANTDGNVAGTVLFLCCAAISCCPPLPLLSSAAMDVVFATVVALLCLLRFHRSTVAVPSFCLRNSTSKSGHKSNSIMASTSSSNDSSSAFSAFPSGSSKFIDENDGGAICGVAVFGTNNGTNWNGGEAAAIDGGGAHGMGGIGLAGNGGGGGGGKIGGNGMEEEAAESAAFVDCVAVVDGISI